MIQKYLYTLVFLYISIFGQSAVASSSEGAYVALAASALILGKSAAGEDLNFVPSIAYQEKNLTFDQTHKGGALALPEKAKFDVNLPTVNTSLTVSYKKIYVALKYETSITEADTSTDETDRSPSANLLAVPSSEIAVEREDQSISFGMNVWHGLNVFTGLMQGETTLTPQPMCADIFGPCTISNLAWFQFDQGRGRYRQKYEEKGPFVGASYAWVIGDTGTLSTSLALAKMHGKFSDNANCGGFGCERFQYEGDSSGASLGLTWSAPFSEQASYFIDLRRQSYSMDGKDKTGNASYAGVKVKTNEDMMGLTAGIQFYF